MFGPFHRNNFVQHTLYEVIRNGATVDFGTGNLCANCHQSRPIDAAVMPVVGGPDITLTAANKRYGSHHGPQANIIGGIGTGLS